MALSDKKIDAVTLLQWGEMKGHPLAARARNMVQIAVETDEVLVAIKRPDGYEDVHPELVAADALPSTPFEYRVAWPLGVEP